MAMLPHSHAHRYARSALFSKLHALAINPRPHFGGLAYRAHGSRKLCALRMRHSPSRKLASREAFQSHVPSRTKGSCPTNAEEGMTSSSANDLVAFGKFCTLPSNPYLWKIHPVRTKKSRTHSDPLRQLQRHDHDHLENHASLRVP